MTERLIKSFRKLRQRAIWTRAVDGGVFVVEATRTEDGWHAHLHVLAHSSYIPQAHLSRQWKAASGSPVVWIENADPRTLQSYLTKYITKDSIPDDWREEANAALRRHRLFNPFGKAHDINLLYKRPRTPCPTCHGTDWINPSEFLRRIDTYGTSSESASMSPSEHVGHASLSPPG